MGILNKLKNTKDNSLNKVNKTKQKIIDTKKDFKDSVEKAKKITILDIFEEFIDIILNTLKYSVTDIVLIPGKQLKEPFTYCALVTFLSLGCNVFGIPFLIDWKGAFLGTVILGIILLIGMRGDLK